jgi:hydroxyacyl-ACP dehydratase HTD2-like protein with hotdog domain
MCMLPNLFLPAILRELVSSQYLNLVSIDSSSTVKGLPSSVDFSFTFTPSLTTLFRFSALMFNAHLIHLDKDWAQLKRGYPGAYAFSPSYTEFFIALKFQSDWCMDRSRL